MAQDTESLSSDPWLLQIALAICTFALPRNQPWSQPNRPVPHGCTTSCPVRRQPPLDQSSHHPPSLETVVSSPSARSGPPFLSAVRPQT